MKFSFPAASYFYYIHLDSVCAVRYSMRSSSSLFILFVRAVDRFTMTILDFVFHCHEIFNSSLRFPIVEIE